MEYKTIFVSNLPLETDRDEVKSYLHQSLDNEKVKVKAKVGSLVPYIRVDGKLQAKCLVGTTITFQQVTGWKETLQRTPFHPRDHPKDNIWIALQEEFIGLSGLEQHDKDLSKPYSHQFEYVSSCNAALY